MDSGIERLIGGMAGNSQLLGSQMSSHMPLLYLLAKGVGAAPIVECGVFRGWSTLSLLLGAADGGGTLTSYDKFPQFESLAHAKVGPDDPLRKRWTFQGKECAGAAADWADGSVHLWFQDTSHELEPTRAELRAWLPKMAPEGVMCGHDYWLHEDQERLPDGSLKWKDLARVKQAVDEFAAQHRDRFRLQTMKPDCGFWILWPKQG
jgi:predicted O-methyltransferase YrrM